MRITNLSLTNLTLPNGATIAREATIAVEDDVWLSCLDHPVVKAWVDEGMIAEAKTRTEEKPEPKSKKAE